MKKLFTLTLLSLTLFSCAKRNLVYFSDIETYEDYSVPVGQFTEPRIQPDDLLSITVTSLNPESNMLFNVGVLMPSGDRANTVVSSPVNENYLVDKDGFINYPVIGKISLNRLTKQEAVDKMAGLVSEYVKDPIVNIRFTNFKVTVIGEVQKPASFVIPTEKITVLEALGMAGDMTAYGKRENVMVIREKDGMRTAARLNLNDKAVLASPYYYLQQNDVVYVEPYKTKAIQADTNPRTFAIISSALSLAVVIFVNLRWAIQ
ncbi:polysaccharide biosynthesis/export family protein [Fontibacter flavus]|uniref:Polysaccharide biosynthesis/export family protein n=1 Tax=Fontibacter flavus TaxID=654838 RepID=A0ABV6FPT3_9BACT